MLSAEQQSHFEAFGFLVLRQALSAAETAAISRDFDELLAEDRRGQAWADISVPTPPLPVRAFAFRGWERGPGGEAVRARL